MAINWEAVIGGLGAGYNAYSQDQDAQRAEEERLRAEAEARRQRMLQESLLMSRERRAEESHRQQAEANTPWARARAREVEEDRDLDFRQRQREQDAATEAMLRERYPDQYPQRGTGAGSSVLDQNRNLNLQNDQAYQAVQSIMPTLETHLAMMGQNMGGAPTAEMAQNYALSLVRQRFPDIPEVAVRAAVTRLMQQAQGARGRSGGGPSITRSADGSVTVNR